MVQGLSAIDKRTLAAQALLEWKDSLIADLGGVVSTQQETLVELVVRTRLLIEHLDSFILSQPSLVNKKRRSLYPIVRDRQHLVDSLARMLGQLGLKKVPKDMGSLPEFLERFGKGEADGHSDGDGTGVREDVPQEGAAQEAGQLAGVEVRTQGDLCAPDEPGGAGDLPEGDGADGGAG